MFQKVFGFVLALAPMAFCADIRLSGTVFDDVGNPVFGAKVALARAGDRAYSDPRGEWRLEGRVEPPDGPVVDTLLVTWKDAERARFPISTYLQTGSVMILRSVHLGDVPGAGEPAPVSEFPSAAGTRARTLDRGPLEIQGPDGPILVPESQAEATIASYRSEARTMHAVDKILVVGGLATAAVGGGIALGGWAGGSDDLLMWGAVTGGCGLLFAVIPLGNSTADQMDRNANELQRQLDERRGGDGVELRILPVLGRHANAGIVLQLVF